MDSARRRASPLGRDAGSLVGDGDPHHALDEHPIDLHPGVGRRELHGVLQQVLEHLAEAGRIRQDVQVPRPRDPGPMPVQQGRHVLEEVLDELVDIDRVLVGREVGHHPHGLQDGVDEAVEPLDLLDRPEVPGRARLAASRVP